MSRNYGLGQRDMTKAGQVALNRLAGKGAISLLTAATNGERWRLLVGWVKKHNVLKMENLTSELVRQYGEELSYRVEDGDLATATAHNYISAINSVMTIATGGAWKVISPTKDCGIKERSFIRDTQPGALNMNLYNQACQAVLDQEGERLLAILNLARHLGLRSKEASLLDASVALKEAENKKIITICDGTKGGRKRNVSIRLPDQIDALRSAANLQGKFKSVMDPDQNWQTWREGPLRRARELVKMNTGGGLHDLRSAFACQRYFELTGHDAPCAGGKDISPNVDKAARIEISNELGHSRVDITNEYLGKAS